MKRLLDTIAEIMTELAQYGTTDVYTVRSFLDMLNNSTDKVYFTIDGHDIVDYEVL